MATEDSQMQPEVPFSEQLSKLAAFHLQLSISFLSCFILSGAQTATSMSEAPGWQESSSAGVKSSPIPYWLPASRWSLSEEVPH